MEFSEKNTQYRETISTNILSQELAQNSEEIGEVSSVVGMGRGRWRPAGGGRGQTERGISEHILTIWILLQWEAIKGLYVREGHG